MTEAVRTTASPAAIWAICVVAVVCLAFWLFMINYADRHPYVRHRRLPDMPGPVLGGIHLAEGGRSVAPNRELPADLTIPEPQVPPQRTPQPSSEPTTAGAPAQPAAALRTQPGPVPAQRAAPGGTTVGGTTPADTADDTADDTRAEAPTEPIPAQREADTDQAAADRTDTGGRS
jgi:hypothetical protein